MTADTMYTIHFTISENVMVKSYLNYLFPMGNSTTRSPND